MKITKLITITTLTFGSLITLNYTRAWNNEITQHSLKTYEVNFYENDNFAIVNHTSMEQGLQTIANGITENNELITKIDRVLGKSAESKLGEDFLLIN